MIVQGFRSINKHIRDNENLFKRLSENPSDFLDYDPPKTNDPGEKPKSIEKLKDLFGKMGKLS